MDRYLLYSARYVHQLDKSDPLVHRAKGNTAVTQLIHQPTHLVGEVLPCPALGDGHLPPAPQRLTGQKQVARTLPAGVAIGGERLLPSDPNSRSTYAYMAQRPLALNPLLHGIVTHITYSITERRLPSGNTRHEFHLLTQ